jgi:hypothetical protein
MWWNVFGLLIKVPRPVFLAVFLSVVGVTAWVLLHSGGIP